MATVTKVVRRDVLVAGGAFALAAACGSETAAPDAGSVGDLGLDAGTAADLGTADTGADAGISDGSAPEDAGDGGRPGDSGAADAGLDGYASGGTAGMSGNYPDPFAAPIAACQLSCEQILGPCYVNGPMERRDISEGKVGLPVRFALKVVRASDCSAVEGAVVDIWHNDVDGAYSGQAPSLSCANGVAEARDQMFFRGTQICDSEGRVDFNTCLPGWYPGRTVHIHFQIRVGNTAFVTSQLYFDDDFVDLIFGGHVDYRHRPNRDTRNAQDGSLRGLDASEFIMDVQDMPDGAILASKLISLNAAPPAPGC